jgi:hypothetical protein
MAFIPLKDFLSIWHFKLIGLIGPRAVSKRVKFKMGFLLYHDQHINTVLIYLEPVLRRVNKVWDTGKIASLRFSINYQ